MHDRIINVADHDVPARLGRDEDLALRLDPLRLLENEVHWVPEIMPGWLCSRMEMNSEIAVPICRDPLFCATAPSSDNSACDRATGQTTTDVSQLHKEMLVMGGVLRA
jgi:hypothetical protein